MADLNIVIAGAAGQGVQSAAAILSKILLRLGYEVFVSADYQSRIRGGHNFSSIRFSDERLFAPVDRIDFLVALNGEGLGKHLSGLARDGRALCLETDRNGRDDPRILALDAAVGPGAASAPRFTAVKLLAKLFAILGFAPETLKSAVTRLLGKRIPPDVLDLNHAAIEAVSLTVDPAEIRPVPFEPGPAGDRLLVSGNEALALGMIAGGIGVYAGYPMTPSTSIMNTLAEHGPAAGIAVEQAEDEIAALHMAIGASYMGTRAATGTSGAGICLMSEALGLAGMSETPVVIVDAQRAGPSTGMSTRTEQSDLLFTVHASHGEFPRAVLSPSSHEEAFYMGAEAFNIAERWHVPVFLLTDLYFADSEASVPVFDLSRVTIDRGPIAPEPEETAVLRRYEPTPSGVSPRAFPGLSKWLIGCDSHEHDESGLLTDDRANRVLQHGKRMRKLGGIAAGSPAPRVSGAPAEDLFLCWGSTAGALEEAASIIRSRDGGRIATGVFSSLFPVNGAAVTEALAGFRRIFTVETSYGGQLGRLLRMETGIETAGHIGKADGRPFTVEEMTGLLRDTMEDDG